MASEKTHTTHQKLASSTKVRFQDVSGIFNTLQNDLCMTIDIRAKAEFEALSINSSINIPCRDDKSSKCMSDDDIDKRIASILDNQPLSYKWISCYIFVANNVHNPTTLYYINLIQKRIQTYLNAYIAKTYNYNTTKFVCLDDTIDHFFDKVSFLCNVNNSIYGKNINSQKNKGNYKMMNENNYNCEKIKSSDGDADNAIGIATSYPNAIILNKLYLGDATHAEDIKVMKHLQITHIVNCCPQSQKCKFENGQDGLNIKYLNIDILDDEDVQIGIYFNTVVKFISNTLIMKNGKSINNTNNKYDKNTDNDNNSSSSVVFVHCVAGISRSSSMIIAFLMFKNKWTFDESFKYVSNKRPMISPNKGFITYLKQWENKLVNNYRYNKINTQNIDTCTSKELYDALSKIEEEKSQTNSKNSNNSNNLLLIDVRNHSSFNNLRIATSLNIGVGLNLQHYSVLSSEHYNYADCNGNSDDEQKNKITLTNVKHSNNNCSMIDNDIYNDSETKEENKSSEDELDFKFNLMQLLDRLARFVYYDNAYDAAESKNQQSKMKSAINCDNKLQQLNPKILFITQLNGLKMNVIDDVNGIKDKELARVLKSMKNHVLLCCNMICDNILIPDKIAKLNFFLLDVNVNKFCEQYFDVCES